MIHTFGAWLRARAAFHEYSFANVCLIVSQRPDASRVAGYKTWQKLGRQVRKGEHGIRILAPCRIKTERMHELKTHGMEFDERIAELGRLREGLTRCIGCGCLSLQDCQFANPGDRASRLGPGPRYWIGDTNA